MHQKAIFEYPFEDVYLFPLHIIGSVHIIGVVICLINSKYKQYKPILSPFGDICLREMGNYTQ